LESDDDGTVGPALLHDVVQALPASCRSIPGEAREIAVQLLDIPRLERDVGAV